MNFRFSASFMESGGVLAAHNYTLRAGIPPVDRALERELRNRIEQGLIGRIHSRDLSEVDDFLKGKPLTEALILSEFYRQIAGYVAPQPLVSLSLERQDGTRLIAHSDGR